jgi:hypothetical protein
LQGTPILLSDFPRAAVERMAKTFFGRAFNIKNSFKNNVISKAFLKERVS